MQSSDKTLSVYRHIGREALIAEAERRYGNLYDNGFEAKTAEDLTNANLIVELALRLKETLP